LVDQRICRRHFRFSRHFCSLVLLIVRGLYLVGLPMRLARREYIWQHSMDQNLARF